VIKFLSRFKFKKKENKETTYSSVITLCHKDGTVRISVDSENPNLAAHISNSIKNQFRVRKSSKPNANIEDFEDEMDAFYEKMKKDFEWMK
jgi:capsular polysaccharide biosynthesis protein